MEKPTTACVTYKQFGAIGDGVADDLSAIIAAHAHANDHRLPVVSDPHAIYHMGARAETVIIATDTDWSTSRFIIDDREVEDHECAVFKVVSLLEPIEYDFAELKAGQQKIEPAPLVTCFIRAECDEIYRYKRYGSNGNDGFIQRDSFILHEDGTVEGDISWDYPVVTGVRAQPIDEETLVIKGGVFTTFANNMYRENGYHYWQRNISIQRSNTEITGLTHYLAGETSTGCPYGGFLAILNCAHITLRDCFVSGHRTYTGNGSAGVPVSMGTYDITAFDVVGLNLIGCRMNHIKDRNLWGVFESSFCKNVLVEDCELSRMDTHMGITGTYTIRRSTLGHAGLNAIGQGTLLIEDSTLYGEFLVNFRGDFGSTWDGEVIVKNCRWIPSCGDQVWPHLFFTWNNGQHDFGYPCSMPRKILIDGLVIDDSNHPEDYTGSYLFWNDGEEDVKHHPYPYALCKRVEMKGLKTVSGHSPQISKTSRLCDLIELQVS